MEKDLEGKLANWNGAQTADYGAICNDLAQLKLNKVPVKSTCPLTVCQLLPAMAASQDIGFLSSMTLTALSSSKRITPLSNAASAG